MTDRDLALEDFKQGKSYKEIAENVGVSESTVKSWASRYWNKDKKISAIRKKAKRSQPKNSKGCNQNNKKKSQKVTRKQGAQPGNINALGAGAPKGNGNAIKHGGYSSIYWDTLSDEEKEYLENEDFSEEQQLLQQIKLCSIREMRIMKALKKYEDIEFAKPNMSGLAVESVITSQKTRHFDNTEEGRAEKELYDDLRQEKINEGKISYLGKEKNTQTITEATYNVIARLQAELTRVQRQKTQCIKELAELHQAQTGNMLNNSIAEDWINAVIGNVGGAEDE